MKKVSIVGALFVLESAPMDMRLFFTVDSFDPTAPDAAVDEADVGSSEDDAAAFDLPRSGVDLSSMPPSVTSAAVPMVTPTGSSSHSPSASMGSEGTTILCVKYGKAPNFSRWTISTIVDTAGH